MLRQKKHAYINDITVMYNDGLLYLCLFLIVIVFIATSCAANHDKLEVGIIESTYSFVTDLTPQEPCVESDVAFHDLIRIEYNTREEVGNTFEDRNFITSFVNGETVQISFFQRGHGIFLSVDEVAQILLNSHVNFDAEDFINNNRRIESQNNRPYADVRCFNSATNIEIYYSEEVSNEPNGVIIINTLDPFPRQEKIKIIVDNEYIQTISGLRHKFNGLHLSINGLYEAFKVAGLSIGNFNALFYEENRLINSDIHEHLAPNGLYRFVDRWALSDLLGYETVHTIKPDILYIYTTPPFYDQYSVEIIADFLYTNYPSLFTFQAVFKDLVLEDGTVSPQVWYPHDFSVIYHGENIPGISIAFTVPGSMGGHNSYVYVNGIYKHAFYSHFMQYRLTPTRHMPDLKNQVIITVNERLWTTSLHENGAMVDILVSDNLLAQIIHFFEVEAPSIMFIDDLTISEIKSSLFNENLLRVTTNEIGVLWFVLDETGEYINKCYLGRFWLDGNMGLPLWTRV